MWRSDNDVLASWRRGMCNLNECVMWLELVDCQYEHFLYQPGGLLSCKPPAAVLADLPALCVRCNVNVSLF